MDDVGDAAAQARGIDGASARSPASLLRLVLDVALAVEFVVLLLTWG